MFKNNRNPEETALTPPQFNLKLFKLKTQGTHCLRLVSTYGFKRNI